MGKTKFGTKIVFFFVILLGAGAVLYAKNCMEQLAAYAVSLMDGAGQAQAQSQLAAMIASDVKKMAAFMAAGLIITVVVGAAGIIDYIRSLDLACSYSDTLAQGDLTQDVEQKYLDRKDSIGNLAAAFHKIRESFAGHLGSVKDNAESLSGHVSSIGKNVDEINGEMEGISATTQQLAASMEESAASASVSMTSIPVPSMRRKRPRRTVPMHSACTARSRQASTRHCRMWKWYPGSRSWHRRSWRSPTRRTFYP